MHGLQSFVLTHSEESDSLLFILCLQNQMPLTPEFSEENSAISLEECVLVFEVFATATRKLKLISHTNVTPDVLYGVTINTWHFELCL